MRTTTKYDYPKLRQQYVTTPGLSIRQLCRENDIADAFSTVAAVARREDWEKDRDSYVQLEHNKVSDKIAEKRAVKLAQIDEDVLEVIHAAVLQLGISLSDREVVGPNGAYTIPAIQVTPADLVKLIDKLQLLQGKPTAREEHFGLGLNLHADASDLPVDVLRDLAALARSKGAGAGAVGRSPLPGIEGARSVN